MNDIKYNAERYYDPTAYEAISNLERRAKTQADMPLVFICSPLSGDIETNIKRARRYSRFAMMSGAIPIAPHLLFTQFMDDTDNDQRCKAIFMGLVLLSKCRQLWCFGDRLSHGMAIEIKSAKQHGMPIRYFNEQCAEVKHDG